MRRLSPLFAVLFVVPLIGSDSPKEYDGAMQEDKLEGTWQRIEIERNGEKIDVGVQLVNIYRGDNFTSDYGGNSVTGRFWIDPTRKPAHLDWIPSNGSYRGEPLKAIYQIDGNKLKIAVMADPFDLRRPKGFIGNDLAVHTYKRVK